MVLRQFISLKKTALAAVWVASSEAHRSRAAEADPVKDAAQGEGGSSIAPEGSIGSC